ncbi:MAG: hypothetical protein K8T20_09560 [Planctomycetes bacterium]|nr:hypothetical protein [Planctomycetota bacterium]
MRFAFPLFAVLALLAGCQSTNPGVPDTQDDVPVPQGFHRAPDNEDTKSYWEQQESFRLYRVTYDGEAKAGETTAYYQREMPHNGWTVETAAPDATGGGSMLSYIKKSERCKIWIKQKLDNETTRVTVEIGYSK